MWRTLWYKALWLTALASGFKTVLLAQMDMVANKACICFVRASFPNEMLNLTPATCLFQTRGDFLKILRAPGSETNIVWQLKRSCSPFCRPLWLCIVSLLTVMYSFTVCPKHRKVWIFPIIGKASGRAAVIKTRLTLRIVSALIGHQRTCHRPYPAQ